MKKFTTKNTFNAVKLFNNNDKLVGEIISPYFINGLSEKIKLKDKVFKIKGTGFLWRDIKIYDQDNYLICKSDISKSRIIYFGDTIEIFTFKHKNWLSNKFFLYKNDQIILALDYKGFFRWKFIIEVDENFYNDLIILIFFNFYMRGFSSSAD